MKTYLNINTGVLSLIAGGTTPIRRLDAKRGDSLELEVVPSAVLPDGATGLLVAKPKGNYAAAPVALDATWDAPSEAGAGYLFALSLNTTELNALFAGAVAEITLMAEITWSAAGKVRSTQTFDLVVSRDVWVGDEGVPTDAEPEYPTSSEIHAALASVDALLADGAASLTARVTVANQAARYALTLVQVQNGDYVYQTDTTTLYEVTDQTALNGAGGYTALATLPWDAITGKPTEVTLAEAQAGTSTAPRLYSPLRVAQAIAALASGGGLSGDGINFIVVNASADNAATNGVNLLAAYTVAKALTPNGSALSATNRATLIIPPGVYSLASVWVVDGEFVDIVALGSTQRAPTVLLTTNTINVTANNVRVLGVSVGEQKFTTADSKPLQVFEDCTGGGQSFGGGGGIFSGTAIGCTGGNESFGADGTFSGTAIDCTCTDTSFGGYGICSGTAIRCVAGFESFGGGGGIFSGKLYWCRIIPYGWFTQPTSGGQIRMCLEENNDLINQG